MQIDARIPLMAQPVQIDSPIAQANALAAFKNALNRNKLIELQTLQTQREMEAAPEKAKLEAMLRQLQMAREQRLFQNQERQNQAQNALANLLATGGYQPTEEYPNQPQVMMNEQAALAEAQRLQAAGQPVRIQVPNQGNVRALAMMANPNAATTELLKSISPTQQRGVVVPAGGAYIPPDMTTPSFQAPFSPRAEPAPVVRPVPNPNSPTGFSYEDMRRPGSPIANAPAPAGAKAPAGYRFSSNGETLEPIPGGPKDKPNQMPTNALKMQQGELDAIATAASIKADLSAIEKQLDDKKLNLGLISNYISAGRNLAGISSETSRNYASFRATLEKMRNDSLRLNKGVQTEGDAVRAWNELLSNINDNKFVKQRLKEIQEINERAIDVRKMNIDALRRNYGLEPLSDVPQERQPATVGSRGQIQTSPQPVPSGSILKFDAQGNLIP